MSGSYFQAMPKIRYYGSIVTNLAARAVLTDRIKQIATLYYPYVVRDGESADNIAAWYYGDSAFDWLIYLNNDIIDPYTQWPKSYLALNDFITKKYGSIEEAKSTIAFYRRKPEVSYISSDGYTFSSEPLSNYTATYLYTDVRVTPETYATLEDQTNYNAISAFDHEIEINDGKRNITLIDNTIAEAVYRDLRGLMNG